MCSPINLSTEYATGRSDQRGRKQRPNSWKNTGFSLQSIRSSPSVMHFKHAVWLCGVPKEQTVQLALKESQLYIRMTIFHRKTTRGNTKALLFQIEKFKVPAVLRICPLPAPTELGFVSSLGLHLVHSAQQAGSVTG